MASLADLAQIDEWSRMNDGGSPSDPRIEQARQLRQRLRIVLLKKALYHIRATPVPEGEQREMVAFAQRVLRNPSSHLEEAWNIALVDSPPTATIDQILLASDQSLEDALDATTLRLLAVGLQPGR
jgi:hypothetical protein